MNHSKTYYKIVTVNLNFSLPITEMNCLILLYMATKIFTVLCPTKYNNLTEFWAQ